MSSSADPCPGSESTQPAQARRAQEVALAVMSRLATPEQAQELAGRAASGAAPNALAAVPWIPYSVSGGSAGIALAFGELHAAFPQAGWDRTAHAHIVPAAQAAASCAQSMPLGMLGGLAGLCSALEALSMDGTRYQKALAPLIEVLLRRVDHLLLQSPPPGAGESTVQYDQVCGLAGILAALLRLEQHPGADERIKAVLGWLVARCRSDQKGRLLFFTPRELMLPHELRSQGAPFVNCGLAHGVPGVLAALALAGKKGQQVPGQRDALDLLARWVAARFHPTRCGLDVPYAVEATRSGPPQPTEPPTRSAWCYGVPGVARALYLAARELADADLEALAVQGMLDLRSRSLALRSADSPTFCHGVAGLLQIVLRFAQDTGRPELATLSSELLAQLLAQYEPNSASGFRDLRPDGPPVESPGLLEGATGCALALLHAAGHPPRWDGLFLLA